MSDFCAALRGRLLADAGVAGLVATRIHWGVVPPRTPRPYIRLQLVSGDRPRTLDEFEEARTARVQCDSFADTHADAHAIAEAVIAALAEPATFGGIQFGGIGATEPRDLGEDSDQGFIHRASTDLLAEHSRA